MRKSKHTQEQIINILQQAESGVSVKDLCRKYGICTNTLYIWKSKYNGLTVNEAKRLKELEDENRRLKRIVADQALDIVMLKDVNSKKW